VDCEIQNTGNLRCEAIILEKGVEVEKNGASPVNDNTYRKIEPDSESVSSDVSVYAKKTEKLPECLFVLNPRLLGLR
jgi:hypothetical protein